MNNKKIRWLIPILMLILVACAPATTESPTPIAVPTELDETEAVPTEPLATETPLAESPTAEDTMMAETPTVGVPVTGGATVNVSETDEFGPVLVDNEGFALYMFEADTQGSDASTCYDACADAWPPLTVDGEPTADEGVDASLLGTFARDDGSMQVTYNGWPLYYYAGDTGPGDTAGQGIDGFGGLWWLIAPSGEPVRETMSESGLDTRY